MKKEHQKTLLQTIKANLERNGKGSIDWVADEKGEWEIVAPKNPLTKYYTPVITVGIDAYGNKESNSKK